MSESDFRCGSYVRSRIHALLGSDPGHLRPAARAALALLRQASTHEPGTDPSVWPYTAEAIPSDMSETRYRRVEQAIHIALTQFAVHQQARSGSMHDSRQSFGRAVRKLADTQAGTGEPQETPVYQRFTAMAQTSSVTALVTHSRGIITQLRTHEIPFDYGRYADDLYLFQIPGRAREIQRRWGRDFHRLSSTESVRHHEGATQS
ncbi:type I-E CRISPR-associated protein Cse2/CasB [Propioniciclava sinopodophylli]|uniref:type I-E CRISPR-associated protein Cse2/CasB n=1 Tax=Propioniciclava sinopodophylli TaxID=1837344 RepID=UPI0024925DFF|nr:type I-E CRISPR-associated protein Cse2/CasB [Propioniciclava sinopodophylli]